MNSHNWCEVSCIVRHQVGKDEFKPWIVVFSQNMKSFCCPSQFLKMKILVMQLVLITQIGNANLCLIKIIWAINVKDEKKKLCTKHLTHSSINKCNKTKLFVAKNISLVKKRKVTHGWYLRLIYFTWDFGYGLRSLIFTLHQI